MIWLFLFWLLADTASKAGEEEKDCRLLGRLLRFVAMQRSAD